MRVAHLISSSGFFGAENVLLNLAQWFDQNGETVFVGALKDKRAPQVQVIERAQNLHLKTFTIDSRGRFDLGSVFQLRSFCLKNKIELLHTHNYKSDLIGLLAAKLSGIPIVATAHGFTGVTKSVLLYEKIDRWILKKYFNSVVVVADTVLADFKSPKRKIIGNGIDPAKFELNKELGKEFRRKYGITDDEKLIGIIGRLSVEKNQEMFIHAAHDLIRKEKNAVKFVVIGNGPEEDKLRSLVMAYDIRKEVIFTGLIENITPVYHALDIFTLTSKTEGIPMTILEAMASRVPVVATKVGGIPQLILDRQRGLLVNPDDKDHLVKQWEEILHHPELNEHITRNAYEFVKTEYSQIAMGEKYLDCYRQVLSQK